MTFYELHDGPMTLQRFTREGVGAGLRDRYKPEPEASRTATSTYVRLRRASELRVATFSERDCLRGTSRGQTCFTESRPVPHQYQVA
jgi:hypothetical protein